MARTKKSRKAQPPDAIAVKGAYRLNILEDGQIVDDSGWLENQVLTQGFQQFLAARLIGAGSSVTHIGLGSGTVPAASTTSLPGEFAGTLRQAVGANTATSTASAAASVTMNATFASNTIVTGASSTLANIGLFGHSSVSTQMFAGNTFASSPLNSNQAVNVTYTVSFS